MKTIVTSYKNPDLDGIACMFAYTELLQINGEGATAAVFGIPQREAQFVLKRFNIPNLKNAEDVIAKSDSMILVDTSNLNELLEKIDTRKVIEIIDHRKVHDAKEFPSAKAQIELVGSAATLVAERFYNSKIEISPESAALLFLAIVSSTVNFQASVTTDRDHKMADWLAAKFTLPEKFIYDMFADKSQFSRPLKDTMADDLAVFTFNRKKLGIAQLELVGVDSFISERLDEIKISLQEIKKEELLDLIFLTCIDLDKAFNEIVVIDEDVQKILEKALGIKFENGIARKEGIMMRKEIIPLVKRALELGNI